MSLRTRITIILSACFLAVAAALIVEGRAREWQVEQRTEETFSRGLLLSWSAILGTERERMLRLVGLVRENEDAVAAFLARDAAAFAEAGSAFRARLRADLRTPRFMAVLPDGTVFHDDLDDGYGPQPLLHRDAVRAIVTRADEVHGVFQTVGGGLTYVLAAPVFGRGGIAGLFLLEVELDEFGAELGRALGAEVAIVGPAGRPAIEADPLVVEALAARLAQGPGQRPSMGPLDAGERRYRLVSVGLPGALGSELGLIGVARDITEESARQAIGSVLSHFAIVSALVLFVAFINWYLRHAFRPLNAVIRSLNALSDGRTDLSVPAPAREDEIGRLAGTFERFRRDVEARKRLDRLVQELEVAARIQTQCLPGQFPRLPNLRFAATMIPARDVGGDFYDVFELPGGRIGLVIGDVADKGVGSAIFMAVARTVLRSVAPLSADPGETLARANAYLCEDNAAMLFVTVFYAVLDPETGDLAFCNAGHNPPVRHRRGEAPRLMEAPPSPALGVIGDIAYETVHTRLAPGERLFLYTDGITEAGAGGAELFGEARLIEAHANASGSIAELVDGVVAAVRAFQGTAEQTDDITCLALAFDGPTAMERVLRTA